MDYTIHENFIELKKLGKCKKLTGTRFATIMGLNAWSTPFEVWCEITKLYQKPFEETIYTKAGKIIEPKVADYLRKVYFIELKSPEDVYGQDYFKKTWGDFFPDHKILGGMWDFIGANDPVVVEVKTTKRAEDWALDIPIYYKLQAALYAHLLGVDDVIVPVSFLEEKDYINPEAFEPNAENTKIYTFKMSEDFPDFEQRYIEPALEWWDKYIANAVSPEFDEKKDAEILKELRKNKVEPAGDEIEALLQEADKLTTIIEAAESKIQDKKDRLKEIDDQIKKYMAQQFRAGDKKVEINSPEHIWTLTKASRSSVDSAALKNDGLYDLYTKTSETLTLKKVKK